MRIVKNKIYYDTFTKEYYVVVDMLDLSPDSVVFMRRLNDKEIIIFSTSYATRRFKPVSKLKEILLKGIYESI